VESTGSALLELLVQIAWGSVGVITVVAGITWLARRLTRVDGRQDT
jgi:hypothetical protein